MSPAQCAAGVFTATGIINERFIAGMTWEQVAHARLLGALLMIPDGRPYGMWHDWIMRRAGPERMSRLLWDSLALMSFQVPIYAAIIAFSGASGAGLVRGVLGAAVMMLVLGRPYGAFLNLMRHGLLDAARFRAAAGRRQAHVAGRVRRKERQAIISFVAVSFNSGWSR